jgi:hypothetical protein
MIALKQSGPARSWKAFGASPFGITKCGCNHGNLRCRHRKPAMSKINSLSTILVIVTLPTFRTERWDISIA